MCRNVIKEVLLHQDYSVLLQCACTMKLGQFQSAQWVQSDRLLLTASHILTVDEGGNETCLSVCVTVTLELSSLYKN